MTAKSRTVVAIDGRPLSRPKSGIRRYLECLLPTLVADARIHWIIYTDNPLLAELTGFSLPEVRRPDRPGLGRFAWGVWVARQIAKDRPEIYWSPRHHLPLWVPGNLRTVVTIHDLVWKSHPETMPWHRWLSERVRMPLAISRCHKMIAVSHATASEIKSNFSAHCRKVTVIPHGVGPFPPAEPVTGVELDPASYLLVVGTIEPRKNYPALLRGFDQYVHNGGEKKLVIVGSAGWKQQNFNHQLNGLQYRNRVEVVTNLSDAQLAWLYQNASGFVMLSLAEGFGLPILEATSFGLNMLLSDIPVFREVGPPWAHFCNAASIQEICTGLEQLEQLGSPQSKQNDLRNWQTVAEETMETLLTS